MYFHLFKTFSDQKKATDNKKHLIIDLTKNEIKFTEKLKKKKDLRH